MHPRHEIVAGLGTMGSLVAAIGCVFALAGGVVAFHGWPELESAGSGPALVVVDVPRAPLQVASVHRKPAAATSHHASAGANVAKAPRRVVASAPGRTIRRNSATTTRPAPSAKTPSSDTPTPGPLTPVADTAEQTTTGVGKAVTDVTGSLGGAVGGSLGQTVTNLGAGLGKTVSNTGTLLANLLRAIKPAG
jgi:hypothetical protein